VLTARSGRHAFHHRLSRLGVVLTEAQTQAAWKLFKEVADNKREVTDEDLRKIVTAPESGGGGFADQSNDHNHVADTLRHLIFG
jgi:isopropylmalate/homocitrate/citramalate synthase